MPCWQEVAVLCIEQEDEAQQHCEQAAVHMVAAACEGAFEQRRAIAFSGAGNDPENGTLSGASLVWTSSRDGQIGTGTSFTKTTLTAGTHTITLTAKDAQGATGTATRTITIVAPTNQPPTASFTWSCGKGNSRQCSFDASGSTDDTGIATYAWSWGDGTSDTKTAATAKHQWSEKGTFNVTLTVTDRGGLTASVTKAVVVP